MVRIRDVIVRSCCKVQHQLNLVPQRSFDSGVCVFEFGLLGEVTIVSSKKQTQRQREPTIYPSNIRKAQTHKDRQGNGSAIIGAEQDVRLRARYRLPPDDCLESFHGLSGPFHGFPRGGAT